MQLMSYDYFGDNAGANGLIALAGLIQKLRDETGDATLLFDNGDFFQGNPLADYVAHHTDNLAAHPMITAMNALAYDAVGLGNHEFDYGLPAIRTALRDAKFPIICSNIKVSTGAQIAQTHFILPKTLLCDDGQKRQINIGIMGFIPPQTTIWDKGQLGGDVITDDIISAAQETLPKLKAAGADIVIALCHSGIGDEAAQQRMENAAVPLAQMDGVDVILTGHTHELFPATNHRATDVIDPIEGTIHGKPTVMAGFGGNHLGMIDLTLNRNETGWQISKHRVRLEACPANDTPPTTLQDKMIGGVKKAHTATLTHIRQPIATTTRRMHSHLATIRPDLPQQILAQAQQAAIRHALRGTDWEGMPVLTATSPFRAGGLAGVDNYIDIPAGPITLRDAAAIYPFANMLCAARRTGAQLRDWLDRTAVRFNQITPGGADQPLINPGTAAYNMDTLHGLTYQFDLTKPARYDIDGSCTGTQTRISDLQYEGRPVADDDIFIVATNSYRIHGGGSFNAIPGTDILLTTHESARDILIDHLRHQKTIADEIKPIWHFGSAPGTSVTFQSAPALAKDLPDDITMLEQGENGFAQYRMPL